jgi:hypothetical protein
MIEIVGAGDTKIEAGTFYGRLKLQVSPPPLSRRERAG